MTAAKNQIKHYNKYSNEQKLLFLYFNRVKLFNAAKSDRLAGGISECTVQKCAKRLKEDKDWSILEKQTNLVNRTKPHLSDMHKSHLNFYGIYPQTRVVDAMDSLTKNFADLSVKKSTVHNFLKTKYNLSFKRLSTQPAARNSEVKIKDWMEWILKWNAND